MSRVDSKFSATNSYLLENIRLAKEQHKRPLSFIQADIDKEWTKWDYVLFRVFNYLESYKCPQCDGYVWLCNDTLTRDLSKKIVKVKCRKKELLEREYRTLNSKGSKGAPTHDPIAGIGISVNFQINPHILDPKTDKPYRMPSLVDYLLLEAQQN